jgi:hypothetical protein
MSALGQKQTCAMHQPMSALPPIATVKADIRGPRVDAAGRAAEHAIKRWRAAVAGATR